MRPSSENSALLVLLVQMAHRPVHRTRRMAGGFVCGRFERGGSVVIAVMALPLLLVFLFAVIDLGRVAFLGAEASTAAHAVCRRVEDRPAAALSHEALQEAAVEASPSLSGEGLVLEVSAAIGDTQEHAFTYRLHDGGADSFAERPACVRTRSVEVLLAVRTRYLTPLGALLADAQGGAEAFFSCKARAQGLIDETMDGGAQ